MKKSRFEKSCVIAILSMILLALLFLPALAGEGDGSGGGQGEPLRLDSSSPYNGQRDVPLPVAISMTFNKNVVNMTVSGNNMKCFSLYAADGSRIPVDVVMADDQIEPEKKRIITLKPLQDLKHNTAYTVKVSSAMQSKSGNVLSGDLTITFITAKDSTAAEPAANSPAAPQSTGVSSPVGTVEPQAAQTGQGDKNAVSGNAGAAAPGSSPAASTSGNAAGSGAANSSGASSKQGDAVKSEQPGGGHGTGAVTWTAIIAGLVLVAAVGYIISRRKK